MDTEISRKVRFSDLLFCGKALVYSYKYDTIERSVLPKILNNETKCVSKLARYCVSFPRWFGAFPSIKYMGDGLQLAVEICLVFVDKYTSKPVFRLHGHDGLDSVEFVTKLLSSVWFRQGLSLRQAIVILSLGANIGTTARLFQADYALPVIFLSFSYNKKPCLVGNFLCP